jgi:hypothetical protein
MDSTVKFIRDFLVSNLTCGDAPLLPQNATAQAANLYSYPTCTANVAMTCSSPGFVGITEVGANAVIASVYPNPSDNEMTIEFANSNTTHRIELVDITGKTIVSDVTEQSAFRIRKHHLSAGMYFLKVSDKSGATTTQKVIFK